MSNGRCFSCGQFHATAHSLTEKMAELTAERDSLAASLEATKPCEPCQRDDHDNCTGDCSSMCCALAAAERERDSALADLAALREENAFLTGQWHAAADGLAALRARVEAAVSELREFVAEGGYEFEAKTAPEAFLQQELKDIISRVRAILAPPEAPTDKGEK